LWPSASSPLHVCAISHRGGGPLILTLSFGKNKLPDSSPGPARRSRSERRMATEEEESETQTDGTLPDLRMYAGTRRGGDRRRNVGAVTRSPIPSRTFPGLLTRIYPAFYQGTPPQPFSPGRIANQPLRCVWNLPSLPTPDNSYVTGASRRDRAAVGLRDARRELGPEEIVIGLADHLPLLPAQQGGSRGVDHEVAPIDVLHEDRVRRSLDDRLQQVVATDQLILGLATLGDVTRIHDDARDDHVVGAAPCRPFEDPPGAYPCGAPALLAATGWRPASRSDSRSARSISATSSG